MSPFLSTMCFSFSISSTVSEWLRVTMGVPYRIRLIGTERLMLTVSPMAPCFMKLLVGVALSSSSGIRLEALLYRNSPWRSRGAEGEDAVGAVGYGYRYGPVDVYTKLVLVNMRGQARFDHVALVQRYVKFGQQGSYRRFAAWHRLFPAVMLDYYHVHAGMVRKLMPERKTRYGRDQHQKTYGQHRHRVRMPAHGLDVFGVLRKVLLAETP